MSESWGEVKMMWGFNSHRLGWRSLKLLMLVRVYGRGGVQHVICKILLWRVEWRRYWWEDGGIGVWVDMVQMVQNSIISHEVVWTSHKVRHHFCYQLLSVDSLTSHKEWWYLLTGCRNVPNMTSELLLPWTFPHINNAVDSIMCSQLCFHTSNPKILCINT